VVAQVRDDDARRLGGEDLGPRALRVPREVHEDVEVVVGDEALPKTKERLEGLLEQLSFFRLDDGKSAPGSVVLEFDPLTGTVGTAGGVRLRKVKYDESDRKTLRPLGSDSRLQLSVIAEGALVEMPPYAGDSKRWKPADGRRLLVFSDSRREAATLGPSLTGNHERQLFRALVVEGLKRLETGDTDELDKKIATLQQTLEIVPEVARGAIQREIDALVEQRKAATSGLSHDQFVATLKTSPRVEEFFDAGLEFVDLGAQRAGLVGVRDAHASPAASSFAMSSRGPYPCSSNG